MLPLGNSFGIDVNGKALLIGGGCGVAPLFYLAKCLSEKKIEMDILFGAASIDDVSLLSEMKKFGKVFITTEDGSLGEKGLVTAHSILKDVKSYTKIFCCGPRTYDESCCIAC